jgi:exodeoxyribonuclease VII large subunit
MSLFDQLNFPPPRIAPPKEIAAQAPEPPRIWSVKSLVAALTRHVESGYSDVRVEGEISNCRAAPSGHIYFTLKDGDAQLACVLFRSRAALLRFKPLDGLRVLARGKISVFEGRGQMQLVADSLEALGEGAIRLAYERLRERLRDEGLFDQSRKLLLPIFAANIGVITSPAGAVLHDILNILRRRHRGMNVLIYPATVQGPSAAAEFRAGLEWFAAQPKRVDVIIMARGGGSLEDLHCFNDEALARALAACDIPTISAIGHETDFTIADFVADLRAPTPSAAAEIITAQHYRVEERIVELDRRVERAFRYQVTIARETFHRLLRSPALVNARDLAARRQQRLDDLCQRLAAAQSRLLQNSRRRVDTLHDQMLRQGLDRRLMTARARCDTVHMRLQTTVRTHIAKDKQRFYPLAARLQALSPHAVLQRGYALVYDASGVLVRDTSVLTIGDMLKTHLASGAFESRVTATPPHNQSAALAKVRS